MVPRTGGAVTERRGRTSSGCVKGLRRPIREHERPVDGRSPCSTSAAADHLHSATRDERSEKRNRLPRKAATQTAGQAGDEGGDKDMVEENGSHGRAALPPRAILSPLCRAPPSRCPPSGLHLAPSHRRRDALGLAWSMATVPSRCPDLVAQHAMAGFGGNDRNWTLNTTDDIYWSSVA